MSNPSPRKELQLMERAAKAAEQMGPAGQEWLVAWLLGITQDTIYQLGLAVRARKEDRGA